MIASGILEFYRFLHKCSIYGIKLRNIEVNDEEKEITYQFAKQHMASGGIFTYENNFYIRFNYEVFCSSEDMYYLIMEKVSEKYGIKL